MLPTDRDPTPTCVWYDSRGDRAVRTLPDAASARRFFARAGRLGLRPSYDRSEPVSEIQTVSDVQSEKTVPVAKKAFKKAIKKSAAKKVAAKAASKSGGDKPAKKRAAAKAASDRGMADVPVKERRVALLKLLVKLGATSGADARPCGVLAEKLGYTAYDVYCLCYHKYELATEGLVKQAKVEGQRGVCYYVTAKGRESLKR